MADASTTQPTRSLSRLAALALTVGLVAGAVSYLGTSLQIPGPATQASTEVLQERGAAAFFEFCSWPKFEPRFWPECRGGTDEWRARGAEALVAHCTLGEPSRMFRPGDCDSDDRAPAALNGPPTPANALTGAIAAAVALAVLVAMRFLNLRPASSGGRVGASR